MNDRLEVSSLKRALRRAGSGHATRETDAIPQPSAGNRSHAISATGANRMTPVDTKPRSPQSREDGDHAMISIVATFLTFIGLRKERTR